MIIGVFFVFLAFFALTIFVTVKMLRSKANFTKLIGFVLLVGIGMLSFFIYDAFYPSEDFFIKEWKTNTELPFPESAEFKWKEATFPDQHNDYSATAVIEVSDQDFEKLLSEINNTNSVIHDSLYNGYEGFYDQFMPADYKNSNQIREVYFSTIAHSFKIGFGVNDKTIVYQRHGS